MASVHRVALWSNRIRFQIHFFLIFTLNFHVIHEASFVSFFPNLSAFPISNGLKIKPFYYTSRKLESSPCSSLQRSKNCSKILLPKIFSRNQANSSFNRQSTLKETPRIAGPTGAN